MRTLVIIILAACTPVHADTLKCDAKPFDAAAMKADVAYLASPELDGRVPGSDGDRAARAYITQRFECLGLAVAEQSFGDTANVIGTIAGETDDVIIVGAHHDHLGNRHLGANDNASG